MDSRNLTEIINTDHVNQKYLPNIALPENVVACSDILETCGSADVLFFVVPHQFLSGILVQILMLLTSSADTDFVGLAVVKVPNQIYQ